MLLTQVASFPQTNESVCGWILIAGFWMIFGQKDDGQLPAAPKPDPVLLK